MTGSSSSSGVTAIERKTVEIQTSRPQDGSAPDCQWQSNSSPATASFSPASLPALVALLRNPGATGSASRATAHFRYLCSMFAHIQSSIAGPSATLRLRNSSRRSRGFNGGGHDGASCLHGPTEQEGQLHRAVAGATGELPGHRTILHARPHPECGVRRCQDGTVTYPGQLLRCAGQELHVYSAKRHWLRITNVLPAVLTYATVSSAAVALPLGLSWRRVPTCQSVAGAPLDFRWSKRGAGVRPGVQMEGRMNAKVGGRKSQS